MLRYILALIAAFILSAHQAKAVPPPDFIFNVGSQLAQFFTLAVILLSATGSAVYQYFRQTFYRQKRLFWIIAILTILSLASISAWFYNNYAQEKAMEEWLARSEAYDQALGIEDQSRDNLDQLKLGEEETQPIVTQTDDDVSKFIRLYYAHISSGRLKEAYAMSKQTVPFEVFASWYASTTGVVIDKLQRIDTGKSSLELTLQEGDGATRYGVLMDLRFIEGKPAQIMSSEVRELTDSANQPVTLLDLNMGTQIDISNSDLNEAVHDQNAEYLILDAREDIEFENGRFPGSKHIRFADIKAGRWIELPTDKPIYVFCWSGIRGRQVAEFLRTKNILARFVENGANGWVKFGGLWNGEISLLNTYTAERYKLLINKTDLEKEVADGAVLVDVRPPNVFDRGHIKDSINIPLMSTPTISYEKTFAQVPPASKVITVCGDYVDCFDAKLTGIELERRGHEFIGRHTIN